mgnify:CR=1 FL=1
MKYALNRRLGDQDLWCLCHNYINSLFMEITRYDDEHGHILIAIIITVLV